MQRWIRFEHSGRPVFGTLEEDRITVYEGDMFASPTPTSRTLALDSVKVLTPTEPTKMVAMWNNFYALAKKLDMPTPEDPLYLIKTNNSFLAAGETIRRPGSYGGKVTYEGEIGIVIGKTCREVSEAEAESHIFCYTCVNEVSAVDLIQKDPTFPQWVRSKSFDTFGVFGPVVAAGIDPAGLRVKTVLNGDVRQDYPLSDMIFPPARLVGLISHDMTLFAGDVIACGTSLGIGSMKEARNTVEVVIDGIGSLSNVFEQ